MHSTSPTCRSLGTAVFSGMLGVTVVGLFPKPVFYVEIRRAFNPRKLALEEVQTGKVAPAP